MTTEKSRRALEQDGFTLLDDKRLGKGYWAFNTSHPIYIKCGGDVREILKVTSEMVSNGETVPMDLCYRRVKEPEKYGDKCYFPLTAFHRRDEVKTRKSDGSQYRVLSWDPMLKRQKLDKTGEKRDEYRAKNLPFFRMYMMGDPKALIRCPIEDINIDFQEFWDIPMNNCWQQHHFVFHNGTSLQKDGEDPGRNNATTDLTVLSEKSRKVLEDTARTIFLSATAHDKIHKVKTSGDIKDYRIDQLPWALRSVENWNKFRSFAILFGHDYFPDHKTWIESLTLEANLKPVGSISGQV